MVQEGSRRDRGRCPRCSFDHPSKFLSSDRPASTVVGTPDRLGSKPCRTAQRARLSPSARSGATRESCLRTSSSHQDSLGASTDPGVLSTLPSWKARSGTEIKFDGAVALRRGLHTDPDPDLRAVRPESLRLDESRPRGDRGIPGVGASSAFGFDEEDLGSASPDQGRGPPGWLVTRAAATELPQGEAALAPPGE